MNRCHLASLQAVNATAPEPVYSSVWNATRFFGLALALGCLTGCAQGAFYHPDRGLHDPPARLGLKYEQVTFASQDGTRLVGWFIPARGYADPKRAKGTVVHFHGNAQNLSAHWQFVDWLPQRGFNLFVFDYRGYGASQGSPEPKGVFEDSLAALDYARAARRRSAAPARARPEPGRHQRDRRGGVGQPDGHPGDRHRVDLLLLLGD